MARYRDHYRGLGDQAPVYSPPGSLLDGGFGRGSLGMMGRTQTQPNGGQAPAPMTVPMPLYGNLGTGGHSINGAVGRRPLYGLPMNQPRQGIPWGAFQAYMGMPAPQPPRYGIAPSYMAPQKMGGLREFGDVWQGGMIPRYPRLQY